MVSITTPACPCCGREFKPGVFWDNANYCRARFLLEYIEDHSGKSTWEISKATGMPYSDATRGMQKAREWALVDMKQEDREQGGTRYRYWAMDGWKGVVDEWEVRSLI